jgi:hypothetical protein
MNPGQPEGTSPVLLLALIPPIATAALIAAGIFQKMRKTTQAAAVYAEA